MSFNIKVKQPELLNIMGALGTLVDEATIEVDANGLKFRGMEPSHIALINIDYPATVFEGFGAEAPVKFGVRVGELLKVIKRFKETIELSEKDSMLNVSGDGKAYKLRLIEASASSTPLPKLDFKSKVMMLPANLDKALGDVRVTSEYVRLETVMGNDNKIVFAGHGDNGEVNIEFLAEHRETKEDSKATYSLDYLVKVVKAIKTDKPVKLEYSTKMPLRLSFEDDRIQYYLAPRVQN